MEYLARIIEALAWPLTVLLAIFLLRKPLTDLLPHFKRLKYKELELEFEQSLENLRKRSHESRQRHEIDAPAEDENDFYLQEVKQLSPRAAILESWIGLETSAVSTAQHFKIVQADKRLPFVKILQELLLSGVISEENVAIINELRALRNKAAHEISFPITEDEAAKFMSVARDQAEIIIGEAWRFYGGCSR